MRRSLILFLILMACGGEGGRGSASDSNSGTGSSSASSGGTGDATAATAGSTGATSQPTDGGGASTTEAEPKFDLGVDTADVTSAGEKGCRKVDFLFVIDNSASMEDNQAALIASFPGFIDKIQTTLNADSDYHIMVVDTDDDGRCAQPCKVGTEDYVEFCAPAVPNACEAELTECDVTRGAGVLHPVGIFASNAVCPVADGRRYMLLDQPDLASVFSCVASVGTAGNPSERPMNGMTAALSDALNDVGGCNEGFLRDDALLVVTFISDDNQREDVGNADGWYDEVVKAKLGNTSAVVVAGLIPQPDLGCGGGGDTNGAHWAKFIGLWGTHGLAGSVCDPDYSPFFSKAVDIIDEACDNFTPPA